MAGRVATTPIVRFMEKVRVDPETGCWVWTGAKGRGYGQFRIDGRIVPAHRWSHEQFIGEIGGGMDVDHTCHGASDCVGGQTCPHRACVNPAHLEAVTHLENVRRGRGGEAIVAFHRSLTHCPSGHPYDVANTSVNAKGHRSCRACGRAKYWRRKAAREIS